MKTQQVRQRTIDQALAKRYGVTDRTVRDWRTACAPLDNAAAMPQWIADHRERSIEKCTYLPPGMEHSNILRFMVEQAASHFVYEASSVLLERWAEMIAEDRKCAPKEAQGAAMILWYGLLHQLKHWTQGDRFNLSLMEQGGSLDSSVREILPEWKERSAPPLQFPKQPVPAFVRELLVDKGQQNTAFVDINSPEGGLRFCGER